MSDQQDHSEGEDSGGVALTVPDETILDTEETTTLSMAAQNADTVTVEKLWTDWQVSAADDSGASTDDRVGEAGEFELTWETVQNQTRPAVTIAPPGETYVGGTYAVNVVAEGTDSATTRTATIDMDRSFDESLYVDGEAGSDDNPGTEADPFETIQKAMDEAADKQDGRSVYVEIAPGTYRESVTYSGDANDAHVLVEGAGPEATVIKGSEVFEGWQDEGDDRFSHEWTKNWGVSDDPTGGYITDCEAHPQYCADSPDLVLRREMVFVDGERMRQVLSADAMEAGTYFVDESNDRLYLEPPTDVTLSEATVEVSVRPNPPSRGGWLTQNETNVTIRNLGIQHVATPWTQGKAAMVLEGEDITAENVRVADNNFTGLFPSGDNITLRNVTLARNGESGFAPFRVIDFLAEGCTVNANNWRGALGGYVGWSVGNKFFKSRQVTVRNTVFNANKCRGLWFDNDHEDVLLEDVALRDNLLDNIFLEQLQGPVTLRRVVSTGADRYGLHLGNAEKVSVEDSWLVDSQSGGVHVGGLASGREFTNFVTDEQVTVYTRDFSLYNSVVGGVNGGVRAGDSTNGRYLIGTILGEPTWQEDFVDTYDADNNTWYAGQENAFEWTDNELIDLETWQNRTGQDQNSVWKGNGDSVSAELLLHWPLDSNADDASGNGYDAATINGSPTYGVSGKVGDAVELDAPTDGDFVAIEPEDYDDFSVDTADLTVAWWHYPRSASNFNQKVGAHGDFNWEQWQFNANSDGGVAVGFDYENNDRFQTDSGTLDLDAWQHFAFTYDGSEAVFYKNGSVLFGPTAMDNRDPLTRFVLSGVDGRIDDLRIYRGALSADEVTTLYNLGL